MVQVLNSMWFSVWVERPGNHFYHHHYQDVMCHEFVSGLCVVSKPSPILCPWVYSFIKTGQISSGKHLTMRRTDFEGHPQNVQRMIVVASEVREGKFWWSSFDRGDRCLWHIYRLYNTCQVPSSCFNIHVYIDTSIYTCKDIYIFVYTYISINK